MATSKKHAEALEAVEQLDDALDALDAAPEPSEARQKFLRGEITWRELIAAGG